MFGSRTATRTVSDIFPHSFSIIPCGPKRLFTLQSVSQYTVLALDKRCVFRSRGPTISQFHRASMLLIGVAIDKIVADGMSFRI